MTERKHNNYIPDQETAIKVAEIILKANYGNSIQDQMPFRVQENDKSWIIDGNLGDQLGGEAHIEIAKYDCKILKMTHGK